MKFHILIIILGFYVLQGNAQTLSGQYQEEGEYIEFIGVNASYAISSDGGLIIPLKGFGSYSIYEDYLVIRNELYPGKRSSIKPFCNGNSGLTILPESFKQDPDIHALYYDSYHQVLGSTIFSKDSNVVSPLPAAVSSILVTAYFSGAVSIQIQKGCEYFVNIVNGRIIEEGYSIFKIYGSSTCSLELVLLSAGFEAKSITIKKLKKLERQVQGVYNGLPRIRKYIKADC